MKKLSLIILIAAVVGCGNGNNQSIKGETQGLYGLKIVVIDSCEYYQYDTYMGFSSITHKGNCNNPIHKQQVQLK